MQVDSPEKLRNVAVAGHNDTGKTTLVSALLYAGGVTTRMHRVEDGNTFTDFDHEETERKISIGLAPCFVPWQQHKVNLLDCPGYGIFFTETRAGMRAADAVAALHQRRRRRRGQHRAGVELRRRDRAAADGQPDQDGPRARRLRARPRGRCRSASAARSCRSRSPSASEAGFTGVVDLVALKAWRFTRDGNGKADAGRDPGRARRRGRDPPRAGSSRRWRRPTTS